MPRSSLDPQARARRAPVSEPRCATQLRRPALSILPVPPVGNFPGCTLRKNSGGIWCWDLIAIWPSFWHEASPDKQMYKVLHSGKIDSLYSMLFPGLQPQSTVSSPAGDAGDTSVGSSLSAGSTGRSSVGVGFSPSSVGSADGARVSSSPTGSAGGAGCDSSLPAAANGGTLSLATVGTGLQASLVDGRLLLHCTSRRLAAMYYWALCKHRSTRRAKPRETVNRCAAARSLHSLLVWWLSRIRATWPLTLTAGKALIKCWVTGGIVDLGPWLAAAPLDEAREAERVRCCWSYRRDSIAWVSSPFEAPHLGDFLSVAALNCEHPAHGFMMQQIQMILAQLANLFQTTAENVLPPNIQLCSQLCQDRRRPKPLLQLVLQTVLKSSKRSVPEVLRSLCGFSDHPAQSCSAVQSMYKETMQRYLMRLRMEFETARCITIRSDKSKVGLSTRKLVYLRASVRIFQGALRSPNLCDSQPAA